MLRSNVSEHAQQALNGAVRAGNGCENHIPPCDLAVLGGQRAAKASGRAAARRGECSERGVAVFAIPERGPDQVVECGGMFLADVAASVRRFVLRLPGGADVQHAIRRTLYDATVVFFAAGKSLLSLGARYH